MRSNRKTPGLTLVPVEPTHEAASVAAEPCSNVARVRNLIATGRYEVDVDLLAARILEADPHGDGT